MSRAADRVRRQLPPAGAAAWLTAALVLAVCLSRLGCMLPAAPCLDAHGERTWLAWAYRHPRPQELFRWMDAQLRPGEPVVVAAAGAEEEDYWWRTMAGYFLPDHRLLALCDPGPRHGACLAAGGPPVAVVSPGGRLGVLRSAA